MAFSSGDTIEISGRPTTECLFKVISADLLPLRMDGCTPVVEGRLLLEGARGEWDVAVMKRGWRTAFKTADGHTIRGPWGPLDI